LRVNRLLLPAPAYLEQLAALGREASLCAHSKDGIRLHAPCPVLQLPGFTEGVVTVQDEAAQLAAPLLSSMTSANVLDACAAPGGKTTHLYECSPHRQIVAMDISPARVRELQATVLRTGAKCEIKLGDATKLESDRMFAAILLDAPCTATGVIRRHPDIKFHRTNEDVARASERQRHLLTTLLSRLRAGGQLLYVTCSVLPDENDDVVAYALVKNPDVRVVKLAVDWGIPTSYGRQTLPGIDAMDGFYFSLLAMNGGTP
jgi:16S rRNA (cytosine967-C5)-methyltransferase